MRIAIVHYHLRTGGVTRIIEHAAAALGERSIEVVVLTGEPPQGRWVCPVQVVEGLAYDGVRPACEPGVLALDLQRAAWGALGGQPDIWHVHNHSLGKNMVLPSALWRLSQEDQRLLLQVHDFPEDGRPDNYRRLLAQIGGGDAERLAHVLYPRASQVHYAVLNGRDKGALRAGGCATEQLHLLPNPVWMEAATPGKPGLRFAGRRLWLYPTRAIRRKNLGEFLLWASVAEEGDLFATTRAPENPAERPIYDGWVKFAQKLKLPVEFELGTQWQGSFASLMQSAHASVTTSMAEGFGMAFLEPWLVGRPVVGRDLPEITHEFDAEGIDLGGLYPRLDVPVDWVGKDVLEVKARQGLERLLGAYGRRVREEHVSRCLSAWIKGDRVDFGRLDEPLQQEVITRLVESPSARGELQPDRLPEIGDWDTRVQDNRLRIESDYSVAHYGKRLEEIYSAILDASCEPPQALSGLAVLSRFLAPERLTLLRS